VCDLRRCPLLRPNIGRFTQQDPAAQGPNLYVYGAGDSVNNIDPTGECFAGLFGSGCNNPVYNVLNGSCANAMSAAIGGGAIAIGSGIFGIVTTASGVGTAGGIVGVGAGLLAAYQGTNSLENGAC
jgi:hypothetical protein